MHDKFEEIAQFWTKIKRHPETFFNWDNSVSYHQIASFIIGYFTGLEYITNIPYHCKFRYWFLVKYKWHPNVWWDCMIEDHCKKNEAKSIRMVLREIEWFFLAEKTMVHQFTDTQFDMTILCSHEILQQTTKKRYEQLTLKLPRFIIGPFAFTTGKFDQEKAYMSIFGYQFGLLYGMSHFSGVDYVEKFQHWLFVKHSVTDVIPWPRLFTERLSPEDKYQAATMASEEIFCFFKEEVRFDRPPDLTL